jgi:hypothetical protein
MAIYVDQLMTYPDAAIKPGIRHMGNQWCHMACDGNLSELHDFAARLGMPRRRFQDHRLVPHYDLTPDQRALAVMLGAREIDSGELVRRFKRDRVIYNE